MSTVARNRRASQTPDADKALSANDVADADPAAKGIAKGVPKGGKGKGKKPKVYTPIPWLDNLLTVVFFAEIVATLYSYRTSPSDLRTLLVCLAVVGTVAYLVEVAFSVGGRFMSHLLPHNPLGKSKTMRKFAAQSWQLVIHVFFGLWEYRIVNDEMGGIGNVNQMPNEPGSPTYPVSHSVRLFYAAQIAVWVFTCMVHRFFDERRKDYFVMYVHHVVTIATVVGSAHINYFHSGLVVLYLHDISDVGVDLLKMANYLNLQERQGFFLSEIAFVGNLVSWIYLRLYMFPTYITVPSITESERFVPFIDPDAPFFDRFPPLYKMCVSFLILLQVLHVYWTYLFLRIAYKILTASAHEAGQQEYEGDSDESGVDNFELDKKLEKTAADKGAVATAMAIARAATGALAAGLAVALSAIGLAIMQAYERTLA